jgi:pimeloyl-ACP methyl ester carboxylesterase
MEHLLLLHGALGAEDQLNPLKQLLKDKFMVHSFSFSGHGSAPFPVDAFSIAGFAEEIRSFLSTHHIDRTYIFGYSMGGYAALYFAAQHAQKVAGVVTLATKFHWDETTAAKEITMLNPAKIEEKVPAFAKALAARHSNWKLLLQQTAGLMLGMGKRNPLVGTAYSTIETPVLLLLGDRDKMVSLDETVAVYKLLPNAALCVLPNTDHPIEKVEVERIAFEVEGFCKG